MNDTSRGFTLHTERLTAPALVVHGGAGAYLATTTAALRRERGAHLLSVTRDGMLALAGTGSGRDAVLRAIALMEADPRYNAGYGAKLQQDGVVRVSAALMDGARTRLGAVYNVERCRHPSRLAAMLLERGDRNLDGRGAARLMAEAGIEPVDLVSPQALARWRELRDAGDTADAEGAIGDAGVPGLEAARTASLPVPDDLEPLRPPPRDHNRFGTVGAVALDAAGELWACTSTGGRGHEAPGRISDTPTPAGNYACPAVAVSATGFGEQILDLNVAGRIATRMLDGANLEAALARTFEEVVAHGGLLGVIAIARDGQAGYAYSTEACGVAWCDAAGNEHLDPHGR